MLIPALHDRQHQRGYLTRGDLTEIAQQCDVPLHRVQAVISFFPHFRTQPPPKVTVNVCRDMSCHLSGAIAMTKEVSQWTDQHFGSEDVEVCNVSCLGRCDRAPAAMVNDNLVANADSVRLRQAIDGEVNGRPIAYQSDWETIKRRDQSWEMDIDQGKPTYDRVRSFVTDGGTAQGILSALENAGLLGMGGAGGRAYLKWGDVRDATGSSGKKYIVCNADESEPGTFKDREILLASPHLTIEGMIIAGLVVGARQGWIYIRHEYPEQIEKCRQEIDNAKRIGALGKNIFGSRYEMNLEVFPSPGGYICGEQTALIEAMEDKRAEPRNRPPELMTNGLHDQPTLLSNVETFAWVPAILQDNGDWFAQQGSRKAAMSKGLGDRMKGKRLFSISGDVARPGVYEVPTGITLGELIDEYCGGMRDDKAIAAVALSGPSGGLLPPQIPISMLNERSIRERIPDDVRSLDVRDLPLDIQVSRAIGYMLGAGIVIYGEGCDVLAEAVANSRFFRNETCGKCVPCRIGSQKITEIGERMTRGQVTTSELPVISELTTELSGVMQATSICGLGQVASNPMQSFFKFFPDLARAACKRSSSRD